MQVVADDVAHLLYPSLSRIDVAWGQDADEDEPNPILEVPVQVQQGESPTLQH